MSARRQYWITITVALGVMMNPINTTMITVAFSRIQESFGANFRDVSWLIASYYIVSAIAQPLMGKVSDMVGAKRIYIWGLLLVCLSSMLAPLSASMGELMAYRTIQAFGTSALHPAGMSLLKYYVSDKQAKALGIVGVFSTFSAAVGPSVGGILIHYSDWKAIFLVNFPIVALTIALVFWAIPKDSVLFERKMAAELDYTGILLFAASMVGWFAFFQNLADPLYWLLPLNVLSSVWFYRHESTSTMPFIDIRILRSNRALGLIYVQYMLVNIILYCILFGLPAFLITSAGLGTGEAGLVMLAMSAPNLVSLPVMARWVERSGPAYAMLAGAIGSVITLILFTGVKADTGSVIICLLLTLFGLSNSAQSFSVQNALYRMVDSRGIGVYSGLLQAFRFIGTITSSCVLGLVFGSNVSTQGLHVMALLCAGVAAMTLLVAWMIAHSIGRQPE
ncbi:MFS transporter [Paenibacillus sp. FSL R10-2736]|uniref:MFS transporter n=1 Tax=Paenibacillus sp. FSL R10-2736 TaxID=2954692 RepID=UPI0030FC3936